MKLKLHWQIFIGLGVGVLLGFAARLWGFESLMTERVAVLGDIFFAGPAHDHCAAHFIGDHIGDHQHQNR